jgi:hypothetical protein
MTSPETQTDLSETRADLPIGQAGAPTESRRRAGSTGARTHRRPSRTAACLAVLEERMGNLERQLDELKGRVNGLIFLIVGAAAAQFILRLVQ